MSRSFSALSRTAAAVALAAVLATPSLVSAELVIGERQDFVDKRYDVGGGWSVVEEDGRTIIRFSEDFRTKNGPDLKVFLSPTAIGDADGGNATDGSVLLGALVSNRGGQDYVLPDGLALDDFASVLVHCEAFSVLWGGGAL